MTIEEGGQGGWRKELGVEGRARGFRLPPPEGAEGAKGERAMEEEKGGGRRDVRRPDGGLAANSGQLFKHIPVSAEITSGRALHLIQIKDIKGR